MSGAAPSLPPPPSAGGNILRYVGEIWRHLRRTRVKAGAGMRLTQTEDGIILSARPVELTETHPFKISAEFDNPATPTAITVTLKFGQVNSATPLFPGSTGDPLNDSTPPEGTITLTPDTYYVYLAVDVTKDGVFDGSYIEIDTAIPADVDPVPDDWPDEGDTGTAGVYYFEIGEILLTESGGVYSFLVSQTITNSLTFWNCDNTAYIVSV